MLIALSENESIPGSVCRSVVCFMVVGTFVYNSWQRLIHVTLSNSNNTPLYSFLCPSISPSLFPSISPFLHLFLPPSVLPSLWCWGWAQGLVHGWYNHSSMEPHVSVLFKKSTFFLVGGKEFTVSLWGNSKRNVPVCSSEIVKISYDFE